MSWFGGAEKLISKVNAIHEKFIETQTELRLLRQQSDSTLSDFKNALERLATKLETTQLDHAKAVAELKAEIRGLELRLNALSEQALHAVAEKAAREAMRSLLSDQIPALPPPTDS